MEWKAQRKSKDKGEPEEASAEIEAGGRRKEIADVSYRKIVENKTNIVSTEKLGLFSFY